MALHSRFDEPPVVLLLAAVLVAVPAFALQVGGAIETTVAAVAVLVGAGLLALRLRLLAPVAVAVGAAGLLAVAPSGSQLAVVALPAVAAAAGLEYALRRVAGRAAVRLTRETEVAGAAGALVGLAWAGIVHVMLPASDDFGVVVRDVGPEGFVDPLTGLAYVVAGPVLVVGLAVGLLARFRLASPLAFAGLEVGSFLSGPGGDSVGSLASLLWVVGVPLLLAAAAVELWLRTGGVPAARRRLGESWDGP